MKDIHTFGRTYGAKAGRDGRDACVEVSVYTYKPKASRWREIWEREREKEREEKRDGESERRDRERRRERERVQCVRDNRSAGK